MRTKLLLAGLAVAGTLLPASAASAVCGWTLEGVQHCGCLESEVAQQVDAATAGIREEHGIGGVNQHVYCAH